MCNFVRSVCAIAAIIILPAAAFAQAAITGVVRDTSGAVLPGVTVEAASPALIEKVRTAVSDSAGQYRIVDLRPGTYSVTFTLAGFNTSRSEGIELTGSFIATVNAELRVGALEETVTVTGAAPIVDIQNARQQQVMNNEVIGSIPTSRQYYSLATLVPGVVISNTGQDVGGSQTIGTPDYTIHGGKPGDGRILVDGLSVGAPQASGANRTMYIANVGNTQETAFSTSGGLGEAETAGIVINMVPREGGNTTRGSFFATYANSAMQGSNFTDELRAKGLRTPNEVKSVWEVSPTIGGPIIRDRLWYYATARHQGNRNYIAGMFDNLNAGDVTKWTYEPDTTRRAVDDGTWRSVTLRLTLQATPRNKFNIFWDEQDRCVGCIGGGTSTASPESTARSTAFPNRVRQATWTSPLTNRVLLEGGWGGYHSQWGSKERPGYNRDLIRVQEQAGIIPGLNYRAPAGWQSNWSGTMTWRGSLSYVTGSHSMKVGYFGGYYDRDNKQANPNPISYRFNNGVPNQLTLSGAPTRIKTVITPMAFYAQDSWVLNRLTLQGGVRYDRQTQRFPEQTVGFTRFIPNGFVLPESDGMHFNDVTPRMAVTYDVSGTGRTAVKVTLGKYVLAQDGGGVFGADLNPYARLSTQVNRAWTDANRDYVPDCDLLNPLAQSPATTGSIDSCGAISDRNFGLPVFSSSYDPEVIQGWGVRPYQWEFGSSVQHELFPRVGLSVGYFRRWYGNFVVTDNRAVTASDFDTFSVPVPSDDRLPGGGGGSVGGFVNVTPSKFGLVDNFVTRASNFGSQTEQWHGVDVNVNVRARNGLTLQAGLSTGKTTTDNCEIVDQLPEVLGANSREYCHVESPFLAQYKGLGAYTIPGIDVLVSGTFQSTYGASLQANLNASNAVVAPSLGRPLAGGAANASVNIVKPETLYGDRINQVDFRVAKVFTINARRLQIGVDLYNALNANPTQAYNQTFGANWLTPTGILPARFAKLSAQLDF